MWITHFKSTESRINYVPLAVYDRYGGSDRVFEDSTRVKLQIISPYRNVLAVNSTTRMFVSIHYHANFGEILQVVWWYESFFYSPLHHVKLVWTEGDVWIGQLILPYYSKMVYHYEVCIDHGGPIIRKEDITRGCYLNSMNKVASDVWDISTFYETG